MVISVNSDNSGLSSKQRQNPTIVNPSVAVYICLKIVTGEGGLILVSGTALLSKSERVNAPKFEFPFEVTIKMG